MPDVTFDEFELIISRPVSGVYGGGMRGYRWTGDDYEHRKSIVRVDIADLSFRLAQAAKQFYLSNKEALDFSFANLEIIDMDSEAEKRQKWRWMVRDKLDKVVQD